jgi:V/A-type H+/Na+-transporting ATPase subunit K
MNDAKKYFMARIAQSVIVVTTVAVIFLTVFSLNAYAGHAPDAKAIGSQDAESLDLQKTKAEEMKFAFIAAALAFGLGAIGAGMAISHVGAAAMGAIAEKPQVAGQALIFVALGEGIAVFGLITAIMIILRV